MAKAYVSGVKCTILSLGEAAKYSEKLKKYTHTPHIIIIYSWNVEIWVEKSISY